MKPFAWKLFAGLIMAAALALPFSGCNVTTSSGNNQSCQSTPCGSGTSIQVCTQTDAAGACSGISYAVGGKTFDCNSCTDCTQAAVDATQQCQAVLGGGDGGIGTGNDGGTGLGNCSTPSPCGSQGKTYQECTTLGAGGTCSNITYRTSDGQQFSCNGCSSCATAAQELAQYCTSGTGIGNTTCSSPTSCGTGGLSYQECTTTSATGQCTEIQFKVSDGQVYTCASCGNCTAASSQLSNHCAGTSTGGTTCSTSTACGSTGVTYDVCTTTNSLGTCTQIAYDTSDGQVFSCVGCSDCSSASTSLSNYCASLGSTGQQCGTTTCGSAATCCNCSGTPVCYTLTSGLTCASYGCQ
ncbi:MAG TPA: hypothetical protein VIF15_12730 [Polyangiaceae bacterium]